jgi:uncharacterized caspase-like protein
MMPRIAVLSYFIALAFLFCTPSIAQAERRVALVIGNARYEHQGLLPNPMKDAADIAKALSRAGFVLVGGRAQVNLSRDAMNSAVYEFGTAARGADVAVLYYAGHGLQVDGANYLVPTDASAVTEADVRYQMTSMDEVMYQLEKSQARLKIIMLDACRNNPFLIQRSRAVTRGLAHMQAPAGTVISFATQPGSVARDGPMGANSPYTEALRQTIVQPGLGLFELFNDVGLAVMHATKDEQQPWIAASPIEGRFYFTPPTKVAAPSVTPPALSETSSPAPLSASSNNSSSGQSLPLIQQATKALDQRNYQLAKTILTTAIDADPGSALPLSFLGYTAYMEANDSLDSARRMRTQRDRRAAVDEALHFYAEAFRSFDRAIQIDPQYAPVRRHRGNAIVAVYHARHLAGLASPNDILDRAIADLQAAVDIDPTSKTSANSLGKALLLKSRSREAIHWFSRAISLDDTYAAPFAGLCTAYLQLGDHRSARKNAQAAAARDSDLAGMPCLAIARGR